MDLEETSEVSGRKKQSYNSFRGKTIKATGNGKYVTKELTIENLIECYNKEILIIPDFQRIVDEEKIELMIETYRQDSESFNYLTNPLQIAKLVNTNDPSITTSLYFLIDGQHRFFMYKKLHEEFSINNNIYVNFIRFTSIDEMEAQYINFNIDNPNICFKSADIEDCQTKLKYTEFGKLLHKLYRKNFKNDDLYIHSLSSFLDELSKVEYLDYFAKIEDGIAFLNNKNKQFYDNYYINRPLELYTKEEQKLIEDKKIFSLKSNNFIDWLMFDDGISGFMPRHVIKTKKQVKKTKKTVL